MGPRVIHYSEILKQTILPMLDFTMPDFQTLSIYVIPLIFAITIHEVAHGWVANQRGDSTAKML